MCCTQQERREVERIITGTKLRGTYLPLRSSKSCPARPIGMAAYQEERLRKELKQLYARLSKAMKSVEKNTGDSERSGFASSSRHLGKLVDIVSLCQSLNLDCDSSTSAISGNLWQVSSCASLGLTEVELMNSVIKASGLLVNLEQRLEKGQSMFEVLPGTWGVFLGKNISNAHRRIDYRLVATWLRANPGLYDAHRSLMTSTGIGLGPCLRPGVDPEAGKKRTASGLVAGDEECISEKALPVRADHSESVVISHGW
eukprot:symbB.v1.2.003297.t1/scaffold182.1/size414077/10